MERKYRLRTLGCKVNQYESQQIRDILESNGFREAASGESADVAVINSCAVTASASAKTRQAARRESRGGATPVLVVGCSASADADRLNRIPGVAGVWGHDEAVSERLRRYLCHSNVQPKPTAADGSPNDRSSQLRPPAGDNDGWIRSNTQARVRPTGNGDDSGQPLPSNVILADCQVNENAPFSGLIRQFSGHQRAFLKIQDGCDAHCTYCIIPRLRPIVRYKTIEACLAEAEALVRSGHREIVLTGIFLGAYGRPTALRRRFTDSGSRLAELVDAVAGVEGLVRLRLSSLEPGDVDDELLDVLASHDCCVPHLHLPLQSGSERVLRQMNRQYGVDDYLDMLDRVAQQLDRPAISTDILVGFPGETQEDFEQTMAVARRAGFCKIHAFPFSPREGTAAARWRSEFIDASEIRRRMERLQELGQALALQFAQQFVGTVQRIVVESGEAPANNRSDVLAGRSDRYFSVQFDRGGSSIRPGDVVWVRVERVRPGRVVGSLVASPTADVALQVLDAASPTHECGTSL